MCFSKPKVSQPKITQPTISTTVDDKEVGDEKERQRKRQKLAAGRNSTILTGSEAGTSSSANTSNKTLLGQ